jgi:hypothetical protein
VITVDEDPEQEGDSEVEGGSKDNNSRMVRFEGRNHSRNGTDVTGMEDDEE